MTRSVAVTGGTGFLGCAVVAALAGKGWRVRVLVRHGIGDWPCGDHEVELVFGDISDTTALRRLVHGVDAVVNLAGLIRARDRSEFMAVNRDGAAHLAAIVATAAPAARLVHVSSLAAREPQLSDYAASKRAGEEALCAAHDDLSWVVVRPPAIYGPRDKETLSVFRWAHRPVVPLLQGREARVCLIHVQDAADAIAALCVNGAPHRVYELSDGCRDGYSWRAILDEAARAVGGTPRVVRVPSTLIRLTGVLAGLAGRLSGHAPILSIGKAREILHSDWSSASDRQPSSAFWSPRIPLPEGFADTVRWYRDVRWL